MLFLLWHSLKQLLRSLLLPELLLSGLLVLRRLGKSMRDCLQLHYPIAIRLQQI